MTSRQELAAELQADRAKQAALRRRLAELGIEVTTPARTASTRSDPVGTTSPIGDVAASTLATRNPRIGRPRVGAVAKSKQAKPLILARDCGVILEVR